MSGAERPSGELLLVATPIGNLGDLAPRAIEALARADVVACEDTRRTGRLLERAGVKARGYVVVNDHTEAGAIGDLLRRLARGDCVALVTDAGTPGVSDPGERLVRAAAEAGYPVTIVPGPSAAIAALVVSGLPTGRFVFEGFLPRKGSGRAERLRELVGEQRTIVLYEAPHRLARTIIDLADTLGRARRVVIARELTKLHEEVWRGTLADAIERIAQRDPIGEHVLVVDGAPPVPAATDVDIDAAVSAALARGVSVRDASLEVSELLGVSKRVVYERATVLARDDNR